MLELGIVVSLIALLGVLLILFTLLFLSVRVGVCCRFNSIVCSSIFVCVWGVVIPSLLSGCSNKSLKTLQLVQNAVASILTRTRKRDHISPILASLHWLPIKSRIEFKILLLTYKALNGQAPSFLESLKVEIGGRAFNYQAPLLWKHLPMSVRGADTLSTFKSRLQTVLFDKAHS